MPVADLRTSETTNPLRVTRTDLAEVCVVRAGAQYAGVPIAAIAEILGAVRPQPLPHSPWFVGGLVLYRGEVLTTVDLRRLLDVESRSPGPESSGRPCSMLVVEGAGGAFGLLVDCVDEVLTVSSEDYEPNPSILDARHRELFDGAYKLEGRLLVMLNPERIDPVYLSSSSLALSSAFLAAARPSGSRENMPARPAEGKR